MTARSPQVYLNFIIGSREKLGISSFSSPFNDLQMIIKFYLLPNVDAGRVIAYANPLCIVEGLTQNPVSCLAHGNRLQSLYQLGVEPELIAAQGAKTADMIFKPQPGAAIRGRSN